jgi:hypothetical protein
MARAIGLILDIATLLQYATLSCFCITSGRFASSPVLEVKQKTYVGLVPSVPVSVRLSRPCYHHFFLRWEMLRIATTILYYYCTTTIKLISTYQEESRPNYCGSIFGSE